MPPFPTSVILELPAECFLTIHDFDMARWLMCDEPTEVFATGSCLVDKRIEEYGPQGMLIAKNHTPTSVEHSSASRIKTDAILPSFPEHYFEAYKLEINHFLEDVAKNGKKPEISDDDGKQALVIAN